MILVLHLELFNTDTSIGYPPDTAYNAGSGSGEYGVSM